jgi:hypothetical protein
MAFDWGTAISVGGSLLGGVMGGSKSGERAAKDAAALSNYRQESAISANKATVQPFVSTGTAANNLLADYLGIDYSGYAPKPELQDFIDARRSEHFQRFGKDYGRNSNVAGEAVIAKQRYDEALKQWEAGLEQYKKDNQGATGSGRLLREFSNQDFVKDPGYNFRMAEGEKGINRALSARGGYDSGAALKSLNRFNQDFASNEFGNAFNRDAANKQSIYQMLSGQSSQGLGAAQTQGNMAMGAATQMGNNTQNAANNSWQAQIARNDNQANAVQSALGNLVYGIRRGNQSVVSTPPFNPNPTAAYPGAFYA